MRKIDYIRTFAPLVRKAVGPEQVLRHYVPGFSVQRNHFALCIVHHEDTASMHIGPNYVHCFGCGFYGDVIEITRRLFLLDTYDALVKLNSDFALGFPIGNRPTLREDAEMKIQAAQLVQKREDEHARAMARFERKLDLEQQLFGLQYIIENYRPDDEIERPTDALWRYAVSAIRLVKFRLDYERFED